MKVSLKVGHYEIEVEAGTEEAARSIAGDVGKAMQNTIGKVGAPTMDMRLFVAALENLNTDRASIDA